MLRFFLLIISLIGVSSVMAESNNLATKIWNSLYKAEQKLNQDMPQPLTEDLMIRKVKIDQANKVVRYEGVLKTDAKSFEIHIADQYLYRQQTLNYLCSNQKSKIFLRLLSRANAQVEYAFYLHNSKDNDLPVLSYKIDYQDCDAKGCKDCT